MGHTYPKQGFMNTNIVQWKQNDQTGQTQYSFEGPAMYFFLYTVGPLTFITFCLWYVFYWWIKREEKKAKAQQEARIKAEMSTVEKV